MMTDLAQKPVVCFPQPGFVDKVKKAEKPQFKVDILDESTVFHVRLDDKVYDDDDDNDDACLAGQQQQQIVKIIKDEKLIEQNNNSETIFEILIIFGEEMNEDGLKVFLKSKRYPKLVQCNILVQPCKELLYSRSKGILESSLLEKRKVGVVGLGSGGSFIAVELAKAGVGNFVLIDFDRIELNNIARHVCGLNDLGRYKTNAVRDILLNKNPFIVVETHCGSINDLQKAREILKDCDLIIAATDNIRSRLNINSVSIEHKITAIYGKCAVRAAGGDVLRVRPRSGPCFSCAFSNLSMDQAQEEVSTFRQAREAQPDYVPNNEVEATVQVGLSSDIIPIGTMIVKLALVELCRGKDSALAILEKDLNEPYYRWANRREQEYAAYPEDGFSKFNQPSILRWYPVDIERNEKCTACGVLPQISEESGFFG